MSSNEPQSASDLPLEDLEPETREGDTASFEALLDVSMPVVIEIGRTSMKVEEILKLGIGSVVELDRLPLSPNTLTSAVAAVPGVSENGQAGLFQVYSIRGVSRHRVTTPVRRPPFSTRC